MMKAHGRLDEAEKLFREAVDGSWGKLGPKHPVTLTFVDNLVALLEDQGRKGEAEPLHRQAFEGGSPNALRSAFCLGTTLKSRGQLEEAEPMFRAALDGSRERFGMQHPNALESAIK